jgi:alpha-ketoglutaric semialdehyde dehydrogenase
VRASLDTATSPAIGPAHDIRRMLMPIGPIAVFGASNFPIAYGVIGGDTASALAAGCPVVVKGHPSHPATGELLAQCVVSGIRSAVGDSEWTSHRGVFSFLHSGGGMERAVGSNLVSHWSVRGVGFTGSTAGGRSLIEIANSRERPIPVFAEMGSCNPVFILPHAASTRVESIADEIAKSVIDSSGQQCTCVGIIFVPPGEPADRLCARLFDRFARARVLPLLGPRVRDQYVRRVLEAANTEDVRSLAAPRKAEGRGIRSPALTVSPVILRTDRQGWDLSKTLRDEIFGPAVVVVEASLIEMGDQLTVGRLQDSLVASVYFDPEDYEVGESRQVHGVRYLITLLSERAGRVVFNGVPTGVRVAPSMVHGGPFPATNRPDTTAVGPLAIERWCRPVCYQNCPDALLPRELQNANPLGILRQVNGLHTREAVR